MPLSNMSLRIAKMIRGTEAEGPGVRSAVWLQGCPLRCSNCCNPEMLKETGGMLMSIDELTDKLLTPNADEVECEGISILGGEPFAQAEGTAILARQAQALGMSVMVFSGYTLDELQKRNDVATNRLLSHCDLLVDGRYVEGVPENQRRWIGSQNQIMHFLSDRYSPEEPQFRSGNTVEIRWTPGSLTINGWPEGVRLMDIGKGPKRP